MFWLYVVQKAKHYQYGAGIECKPPDGEIGEGMNSM